MDQRTRLAPDIRAEQLLTAALELAGESNYLTVTREAIAKRAGVAPGLVSRYFGCMSALRRGIMRAAVERECVAVIAQGLSSADAIALSAAPSIKNAAANHLKKV